MVLHIKKQTAVIFEAEIWKAEFSPSESVFTLNFSDYLGP